MEKDFETVLLFDIYAPLLTSKQQRLCDMYYNQDYSLSEIAQIESTTRQAVMDGINKARRKLMELERSIQFSEKARKTILAIEETKVPPELEYLKTKLLDIWE